MIIFFTKLNSCQPETLTSFPKKITYLPIIIAFMEHFCFWRFNFLTFRMLYSS
jgi:hypothetical protein